MMTQIKMALGFLVGAVYTVCLGILIIDWKFVSVNLTVVLSLTSALAIMTLLILAFILRFFIVNWKRR